MDNSVGSIYGRQPEGPGNWGQRQPIGIGHGGQGDLEFRPMEPSGAFTALDSDDRVEVPACLTIRQYLDIVFGSQGD